MNTAAHVLNQIRNAKRLAQSLAQTKPGEAPWSALLSLLEAYEARVTDHWPLSESEKEACRLGWFSVKNIEEAFPDLHAVISEIAHDIRHSGES